MNNMNYLRKEKMKRYKTLLWVLLLFLIGCSVPKTETTTIKTGDMIIIWIDKAGVEK